MSQVKFEQREDIRVTQSGGNGNGNGAFRGRGGPPPPPSQTRGHKEGLLHEAGEALTKGAGPGGYLAVSRTRSAGSIA